MKDHRTKRREQPTQTNIRYPSLRSAVEARDNAKEQAMLSAAHDLWQSLFRDNRKRFPAADSHENRILLDHGGLIEDRLDELLFSPLVGMTLPPRSFVPTPRESILLLSAAWLQNLGFMWGLFDDEVDAGGLPLILPNSAQQQQRLESLTASTMSRTELFLTTRWNPSDPTIWTQGDRQLLGWLCLAQQPTFNLGELEEKSAGATANALNGIDRPRDSVHLMKLAALLRLANVTVLNGVPCPLLLRERLQIPGVVGPESAFGSVTQLVIDTIVDHEQQAVRIRAIVPDPVDLMEPDHLGLRIPLVLDARPMIEHLRRSVEAVVQQSADVLHACENTHIRTVEVEPVTLPLGTPGTPARMPAVIPLKDFVHQVWPLQLSAMTCASEEACCFGLVVRQMLLQEIRGAGSSRFSLRHRLYNKCQTIRKLQRYNVLSNRLVQQLRGAIRDWVDHQSPTQEELTSVLRLVEAFLSERAKAIESFAEPMRDRLNAHDQFLVYGFSRNVMQLLEHHHFDRPLWAVSCAPQFQRPAAHWQSNYSDGGNRAGEDARLVKWCEGLDVEYRFIDVRELPSRVQSVQSSGGTVVFLAGCRSAMTFNNSEGRLDRYECFTTIGNKTVATTVRRENGRVLVVAEQGKLATAREAKWLTAHFDTQLREPERPVHLRIDRLVQGLDFDELLTPE